MIPRYYLNELESANDVAHDLVSSFSHLVAQANLYAEKKDTYGYVMGLEQMLLRQRFEGGRKPESTKAYGLFKSLFGRPLARHPHQHEAYYPSISSATT